MKRFFVFLSVLSLCMVLTACGHSHTWNTATCEEPMTCAECGETNGEPMGHMWQEATCEHAQKCIICGKEEGEVSGHKWMEATCTEPKMCSVCGYTEGVELGHDWTEGTCIQPRTCKVCKIEDGSAPGHSVETWKAVQQPSCTAEGKEAGKCKLCGETIEQAIPMKDHNPGKWKITKEATDEDEGTRERFCTVCGTCMDDEKYSLTEEEAIKYYKKSCQKIAYNDLARYPDSYEGERVKFSGKVVQVCSEAESWLESSQYRVATNGSYRNVVYIYAFNYGSGYRILEDDYITFYGEADGLLTYETVMGASVTIPLIAVEYIE